MGHTAAENTAPPPPASFCVPTNVCTSVPPPLQYFTTAPPCIPTCLYPPPAYPTTSVYYTPIPACAPISICQPTYSQPYRCIQPPPQLCYPPGVCRPAPSCATSFCSRPCIPRPSTCHSKCCTPCACTPTKSCQCCPTKSCGGCCPSKCCGGCCPEKSCGVKRCSSVGACKGGIRPIVCIPRIIIPTEITTDSGTASYKTTRPPTGGCDQPFSNNNCNFFLTQLPKSLQAALGMCGSSGMDTSEGTCTCTEEGDDDECIEEICEEVEQVEEACSPEDMGAGEFKDECCETGVQTAGQTNDEYCTQEPEPDSFSPSNMFREMMGGMFGGMGMNCGLDMMGGMFPPMCCPPIIQIGGGTGTTRKRKTYAPRRGNTNRTSQQGGGGQNQKQDPCSVNGRNMNNRNRNGYGRIGRYDSSSRNNEDNYSNNGGRNYGQDDRENYTKSGLYRDYLYDDHELTTKSKAYLPENYPIPPPHASNKSIHPLRAPIVNYKSSTACANTPCKTPSKGVQNGSTARFVSPPSEPPLVPPPRGNPPFPPLDCEDNNDDGPKLVRRIKSEPTLGNQSVGMVESGQNIPIYRASTQTRLQIIEKPNQGSEVKITRRPVQELIGYVKNPIVKTSNINLDIRTNRTRGMEETKRNSKDPCIDPCKKTCLKYHTRRLHRLCSISNQRKKRLSQVHDYVCKFVEPKCPIRETVASILRKKPPVCCKWHHQDVPQFHEYCMTDHKRETNRHILLTRPSSKADILPPEIEQRGAKRKNFHR